MTFISVFLIVISSVWANRHFCALFLPLISYGWVWPLPSLFLIWCIFVNHSSYTATPQSTPVPFQARSYRLQSLHVQYSLTPSLHLASFCTILSSIWAFPCQSSATFCLVGSTAQSDYFLSWSGRNRILFTWYYLVWFLWSKRSNMSESNIHSWADEWAE